jgi:hypothetical protein
MVCLKLIRNKNIPIDILKLISKYKNEIDRFYYKKNKYLKIIKTLMIDDFNYIHGAPHSDLHYRFKNYGYNYENINRLSVNICYKCGNYVFAHYRKSKVYINSLYYNDEYINSLYYNDESKYLFCNCY